MAKAEDVAGGFACPPVGLEDFANREQLLNQAESGLPAAKDAAEQHAAMVLRRKEEMGLLQSQAAAAKEALVGLAALENEFTWLSRDPKSGES